MGHRDARATVQRREVEKSMQVVRQTDLAERIWSTVEDF